MYDATGPYTGPGGRSGNIADSVEIIGTQSYPSSNYRVGQIIPSKDGIKRKVTSITPPTEDRPYGTIYTKVIQ